MDLFNVDVYRLKTRCVSLHKYIYCGVCDLAALGTILRSQQGSKPGHSNMPIVTTALRLRTNAVRGVRMKKSPEFRVMLPEDHRVVVLSRNTPAYDIISGSLENTYPPLE